MKTLKLILSILCYSGTGIVFVDKQLEGVISEVLKINPASEQIIYTLIKILIIIKIIWYIIDKYLEYKERKQKMRKNEQDENG